MKRRFTVTWRPSAEAFLARNWPAHPQRQALAAEIDALDKQLGIDPDAVGETRPGNVRIWAQRHVVVVYETLHADCRVDVLVVRFPDRSARN